MFLLKNKKKLTMEEMMKKKNKGASEVSPLLGIMSITD